MPTYRLPGSPVALRPICVDDVDAVLEWVNDPDVVRNFAGMAETITREQELAYLQRMVASEVDRLYAVVDPDGRYLGNVGVHQIYWPARNGRLGLVLARHAHGRGYGTAALRTICAVGFRVLQLHKLWLVHYADNARMAHLAGKLGFVREGVLRDEYHHRGTFHDMVRHSLLEGELAEVDGLVEVEPEGGREEVGEHDRP
ncbi:MAG: GNAT family N-acetyltransferase [Myxococcota bacterium]